MVIYIYKKNYYLSFNGKYIGYLNHEDVFRITRIQKGILFKGIINIYYLSVHINSE